MKTAQENGAISGSDYQPESVPFSGGGYRLGNTTTPTAKIQSTTKKETRMKITMWKNGFTVAEGPLRDYNDPGNQSFLDSIKQGVIPPELQLLGQTDINVDLLDSRGEVYKPPLPIVTPFSGSGQKLGSTSSTVVKETPKVGIITELPQIDETQPITSIQIRLQDGTRLVGKFNHTHCIKHIRAFINCTKPTNSNFQLTTSFPQKILADENQTIIGAGLLNSVVVQKII